MTKIKANELVSKRIDTLLSMPSMPSSIPSSEEREELYSMLHQQLDIKASSKDELEIRLHICGEIYRQLSKTMTARGVKILPVSEMDAAKIILGLMHPKRVGEVFDDYTPLMIYDLTEGTYAERNVELDRLINIIEPTMKKNGREETRSRIIQNCGFASPTKNENFAVLGNGIFNMKTHDLIPFSPDYIFLSKASVNWNPDAKCPVFPNDWTFDGFLDEQFDGDIDSKLAVYQLLQLALLTNKSKNVFVYFYSSLGRTGKGTLTELIRQLVGPENSGSANIEQLEQPFGLESVYNKSFIYGNENDNVFAKSSMNIKNLSTGDSVTVNRKSIVNITVCATPLIVQSMNNTPVFKGLDGGVKNRMRILEFKHSYYEDDNEDVKLKYIKTKEFLEFLAYQVLTMPVEPMIDPQSSRDIKASIEMESNSVFEWFADMMSEFRGSEFATSVLFDTFRAWLKAQNKKDNMSRLTFSKRLVLVTHGRFEFCSKNMLPNMDTQDIADMTKMLKDTQMLLPSETLDDKYQYTSKRQSGFRKL